MSCQFVASESGSAREEAGSRGEAGSVLECHRSPKKTRRGATCKHGGPPGVGGKQPFGSARESRFPSNPDGMVVFVVPDSVRLGWYNSKAR